MRVLVRLLAVVVGVALAIGFLGPMAPEGSMFEEWGSAFREALNAWWGFPFGLPGAPGSG